MTYKQRNVESKKFVTIGERIHCISPVIREAMATFNPDPILERAAQQIKAGATYLDVNIGPAESNGPELMTWAVKLLQENFNNVPLALDTANKRAIEAGIKPGDVIVFINDIAVTGTARIPSSSACARETQRLAQTVTSTPIARSRGASAWLILPYPTRTARLPLRVVPVSSMAIWMAPSAVGMALRRQSSSRCM